MSASALRRHKKREKEKLAGGGLTDIGLALQGVAELEDTLAAEQAAAEQDGEDGEEDGWEFKEVKKKEVEKGKIGEGKAHGLTAKQRNDAVSVPAHLSPQSTKKDLVDLKLVVATLHR